MTCTTCAIWFASAHACLDAYVVLLVSSCLPLPACPPALLQAGIFQVTFILGSGLVFFAARTPTDGGGYSSF